MSKFFSRFAVLVAGALVLAGCVPTVPPPDQDVKPGETTTIGAPSFTRDLQGFAPDKPKWVFLSVEMTYSAADRETHWYDPTQYRVVPTEPPGEQWAADLNAMRALSQNDTYFTGDQTAGGKVTLVYQVPPDQLVGATLATQQKDQESGAPTKSFDLNIAETPQIGDAVGTKPLAQTQIGESAELTQLAVTVKQVQSTTLIAGMAPQYGSKFAVITFEVTWNGEGTYPLDSLPDSIKMVNTPGQASVPNRLASRMANDENGFFSGIMLKTGETQQGVVVFELQDETDPYLDVTIEQTQSQRFAMNWPAAEQTDEVNKDGVVVEQGSAGSAKPLSVEVLEPATVEKETVKVQVKITNDTNSAVFPNKYLYLRDGQNRIVNVTVAGMIEKGLAAEKSVTGEIEFATPNGKSTQLILWNESGSNLARLAVA